MANQTPPKGVTIFLQGQITLAEVKYPEEHFNVDQNFVKSLNLSVTDAQLFLNTLLILLLIQDILEVNLIMVKKMLFHHMDVVQNLIMLKKILILVCFRLVTLPPPSKADTVLHSAALHSITISPSTDQNPPQVALFGWPTLNESTIYNEHKVLGKSYPES